MNGVSMMVGVAVARRPLGALTITRRFLKNVPGKAGVREKALAVLQRDRVGSMPFSPASSAARAAAVGSPRLSVEPLQEIERSTMEDRAVVNRPKFVMDSSHLEGRELRPRIAVIGVGGAGGNAVSNMIKSGLSGVDFIVANTDAQALRSSLCETRLQLGHTATQGLGAGAKPEIGAAAAEEALPELVELLHGHNMLFITAGMGGGTGTGAAPVIARAAREMGILTVAVVSTPFNFEGRHRQKLAASGITNLMPNVDTMIAIPNQNLLSIADSSTTFSDSFKRVDNVLLNGVKAITDLIVQPGLINLDFADVNTIMKGMGRALMGTGEAEGSERASTAAELALRNPLLGSMGIHGAGGVLVSVSGGEDMTLFEVDTVANRIREEVDEEANIIFGATYDESLAGKIRVSVIITGLDATEGLTTLPGFESHTAKINTQRRTAGEVAAAAVTPAFDDGGKKGTLWSVLKKYW